MIWIRYSMLPWQTSEKKTTTKSIPISLNYFAPCEKAWRNLLLRPCRSPHFTDTTSLTYFKHRARGGEENTTQNKHPSYSHYLLEPLIDGLFHGDCEKPPICSLSSARKHLRDKYEVSVCLIPHPSSNLFEKCTNTLFYTSFLCHAPEGDFTLCQLERVGLCVPSSLPWGNN